MKSNICNSWIHVTLSRLTGILQDKDEQSDVEADPSKDHDEKEDVQEENYVVSVITEEKIEETPKDD
ncbi:unnamed protein product [Caenorhabditis nigoni]